MSAADDEKGDADEIAWYAARDKVIWNTEAQRWYVDASPVHAGMLMEVLTPDGWRDLGVESHDCGRELRAVMRLHGLLFTVRVAGFSREMPEVPVVSRPLRWPR